MIQPNEPIKRFEPLWGNWYADELLGEGSYGRVYRIVRHDGGGTYYSACKHITIPKNDAEVQSARAMGMDDHSTYTYFSDMASRILNEINIMYALRGESNIVTYEDHFIVHDEGSLKWDVFIRMELLIPLSAYIVNNTLEQEEVRRLGTEVCTALEACEAYKIIHRDIKEGNLFLNPRGTYKLGDFGIARELSSGNMSMSMRGTPSYVAPEVYNGQPYDATVDIYSLGILMYKLLNGGRYPFFPNIPQPVTMESSEQAFALRMKGNVPPPPAFGDEAINSVVMKAISFDPHDRFSSASEMKAALLSREVVNVPRARRTAPPVQPIQPVQPVQPVQPAIASQPLYTPSNMQSPAAQDNGTKKKIRPIALAGIIGGAVLILVLAVVLVAGSGARKAKTYKQAVALEVAGQSSEALELFTKIPNYQDSADHINDLRIARINESLSSGDAAGAKAFLDEVTFSDPNEETYYRAKVDFANGNYALSFSEITTLCSNASVAAIYDDMLLDDTGMWIGHNLSAEESLALREQFAGNRTALKYINNGIYTQAELSLLAGDPESAQELFTVINDYSDSADRVSECIYAKAETAYSNKDYQEAYDLYAGIADYSDANDKAMLSRYKLGCEQFSAGDYALGFEDIYASLSAGFVPEDGFIADNADKIYAICTENYISGADYELALSGFTVLGSYERSADYCTLCSAHINGVSTADVSTLTALIGFEDAGDLLLSDFSTAFTFLEGKWSCSSGYLAFEDGVGLTFTLSAPDFGDKWGIGDGIIYFYDGSDQTNIKEAFKLSITSANELTCYAYKNSKTYTLVRK